MEIHLIFLKWRRAVAEGMVDTPAREIIMIRLERVRAKRRDLARDLDIARGRFYTLDTVLAAREAELIDLLAELKGEENSGVGEDGEG
jgi:hypothetical protein